MTPRLELFFTSQHHRYSSFCYSELLARSGAFLARSGAAETVAHTEIKRSENAQFPTFAHKLKCHYTDNSG